MNKIVSICVIFACYGFSVSADEWVPLNNTMKRNPEITLVSSDVKTSVIKFSFNGFNKINISTPEGEKAAIRLPGGSSLLIPGEPDLAKITASVIIPDMAGMKVEVISSSYKDFNDIDIAPSKGNLYRNIKPSEVPFVYGKSYVQNAFFPGKLSELRDPYILRDFRGQTVVVYPFQYNPVSRILRVYSDIIVRVYEDGNLNQSSSQFLRKQKSFSGISKEFHTIYSNHFKNFPGVQYTVLPEQGKMLIISDAAFMAAMQPFINWKLKKGIQVEMVDMASVGTTETEVKTYVSNYYTNNGLTYLLLVGDYQQIPSPLSSPAQSGGASDPSYGYLSGSDSYPEIFVGRFSAQTVADVETQVQRVLDYEINPVATGTYYDKGVCIASDQGPGDDNEYDFEHERNIRADLLGFTYTDVAELYDGTQGVVDDPGNPTNTDLFNLIQSGVSIINYTGHGSSNSCSTTGFSSSDVANLTNFNMLPFFWSVACVNGDFTNGTCLAEAFLRAQSGGQPTGAIATFMSSINQSWDPPMDGQDEMVDLLVGSSVNHTMRTFGGLSVNGCMHMNDEYGSAGAEMTDTWHCFGDPSLMVRTAVPVALSVSHTASVVLGTTSLVITCNTDSAIAALTINGVIIGTGMVLGGNVTISFPGLLQVDSIDVTVTAFNSIPYMGIVGITGSGVGIQETSNSGLLWSVHPNPAKGDFVISVNLAGDEKIMVSIYDNHGRLVSTLADRLFVSGNHQFVLDAGQFSAGIYSCRIVTESLSTTRLFNVIR